MNIYEEKYKKVFSKNFIIESYRKNLKNLTNRYINKYNLTKQEVSMILRRLSKEFEEIYIRK